MSIMFIFGDSGCAANTSRLRGHYTRKWLFWNTNVSFWYCSCGCSVLIINHVCLYAAVSMKSMRSCVLFHSRHESGLARFQHFHRRLIHILLVLDNVLAYDIGLASVLGWLTVPFITAIPSSTAITMPPDAAFFSTFFRQYLLALWPSFSLDVIRTWMRVKSRIVVLILRRLSFEWTMTCSTKKQLSERYSVAKACSRPTILNNDPHGVG